MKKCKVCGKQLNWWNGELCDNCSLDLQKLRRNNGILGRIFRDGKARS